MGYSSLNYPDWWYNEPTDVDDDVYFDDPPDEHTDLTEKLHRAMGTSNDGTTYPWNIDGINEVLRDHGYSNWASNDYYVSWNEVTDEISNSKTCGMEELEVATPLLTEITALQ